MGRLERNELGPGFATAHPGFRVPENMSEILDSGFLGSSDLLEFLSSLRSLLSENMQGRWRGIDEPLAEGCAYALGSPGKLLRPLFLIESARAVGGDIHQVLPAAIAAESGHVASLVHDDVIDGDEFRRGMPSVFAKYGIDDAIVIGDALIFDLFYSITLCQDLGVSSDRVVSAIQVVAQAGVDLCRGQSLEAAARHEQRFDVNLSLMIGRLKTAAYFRCVCQLGAILGGGQREWISGLGDFGEALGCAFQIYDDLLSFTSSSSETGKPQESDIRNGRLTLPVILAHDRSSADRKAELQGALSGDGDPESALQLVKTLVFETDAVNDAIAIAQEFVRSADDALTRLPHSKNRTRLTALVNTMIDRVS